jgi:hypothetical protein
VGIVDFKLSDYLKDKLVADAHDKAKISAALTKLVRRQNPWAKDKNKEIKETGFVFSQSDLEMLNYLIERKFVARELIHDNPEMIQWFSFDPDRP